MEPFEYSWNIIVCFSAPVNVEQESVTERDRVLTPTLLSQRPALPSAGRPGLLLLLLGSLVAGGDISIAAAHRRRGRHRRPLLAPVALLLLQTQALLLHVGLHVVEAHLVQVLEAALRGRQRCSKTDRRYRRVCVC